jgi:quercetin dioxygenase-like cupin family protein
MPDVTVKRSDELEAIFGGHMRRARAGLGVSSFGMQIIEMPPDATQYPEHDHSHDGQEEVYMVLAGSATLQAGGEEYTLEPGVLARVGPTEKRKIVTGDENATILALGAVPGEIYHPPEFSEEGAPDPMGAKHAKAETQALAE